MHDIPPGQFDPYGWKHYALHVGWHGLAQKCAKPPKTVQQKFPKMHILGFCVKKPKYRVFGRFFFGQNQLLRAHLDNELSKVES